MERAAAADHLLDLVGPDAGGVDDDPGPHLELARRSRGRAARTPTTRSPSRRKPVDLGPGRDVRAVAGRGAGDRQHQPGVVDLAVVVADRAGERVGAQVRGDPGDLPCGTGAGAAARPCRTCPTIAIASYSSEPGADVGPLPAAVGAAGRGTAPAGPGAARAGSSSRPRSCERLAHQAEVEHLEVAQPAVDQLAAAAAGADGQVALLEQPGGEPAGHGVEGRAGADDPAADDEDVELPVGGRRRQRGERLVASPGAECAGLGHVPILPGRPAQPQRVVRHPAGLGGSDEVGG